MRNGKIWLSKNIKLDKDYRAVLNFTETNMINLMSDNNNLVYYDNKYSFIRETGEIVIGCRYNVAIQANYMAFQNPDYSNKVFFAFIDEVIYTSEKATTIRYTIDVWSTWYEYWNSKACFVIREHVRDDTRGIHTIDEGLGTGEYYSTILQPSTHANASENPCYVISTARLGQGMSYGTFNESIPNGNYYLAFKTVEGVKAFCSYFNSQGLDSNINGVFIAYQEFFTGWSTVNIDGTDYEYSTHLKYQFHDSYTIAVPNYLANNYIPKNKKLLCYPYSFLQVSNNTGTIVNYKWEDFTDWIDVPTPVPLNEARFGCDYALDVGCSVKLYPQLYRNILNNHDEAIVLGKLPVGSYNSDTYTNWLTQNSVNIAGDLLMSHLELLNLSSTSFGTGGAGGMSNFGAMENLGGTFMNMGQSTLGVLGSMYKASFMPNQVRGNLNCGDVNYLTGLTSFVFKRMSVKNEYAKIIDDFFTRQGYKVNTIKVPNMSHRQNYNYVQISSDDNVAYVNNHNGICPPSKDIDMINKLFRRGITIWNNHTNLGDYSVSNNITN